MTNTSDRDLELEFDDWCARLRGDYAPTIIIDPVHWGAKSITIKSIMDGMDRLVNIEVTLNDNQRLVIETVARDGDRYEEAFDDVSVDLSLNQARELRQAIDQAIVNAEAIPDWPEQSPTVPN